jgi:putative membrane protein
MKTFFEKFLSFINIKFHKDFPTLFSRIAIIGVIALPLIYSVLYLWAFWDPYQKVDNLPVAFVNMDKGGFDNNHIHRNIGLELQNEIAKKDVLKFSFTTLAEAQSGLENKKYYAYFIIPNNFTSNILSVTGDHPQQAKIEVRIREASSVVAAKIVDRVAAEISENLSHKITQEYFDNVFIQSRGMVENLQKAVDGAGALNRGINSAKSGSLDLANGLSDALSGSKDLSTGLNSAVSGGKTVKNGLNTATSGASSLKSGLAQLSNGADKLTTNLESAQTGANQIRDGLKKAAGSAATLSTYTQQAASGAKKLSAGLKKSAAGATSLSSGLTGLSAGLPQLTQGIAGIVQLAAGINQGAQNSQQLAAGTQAEMQQLMQAYPALASDPTAQNLLNNLTILGQAQVGLSTAAAKLSGVAGQVQSGFTSASAGVGQLTAGAAVLQSGITQLKAGSDSLALNLGKISVGQQQLASGLDTLESGGASLASGLSSLSSGSASLANGIDDAYGGSNNLANGLYKLSDGQTTLVEGLTDLNSGGQQLSSGLGDLKNGSEKLSNGLETASSGTRELYQKLQAGYNDSKDQVDANKNAQQEPVLANPVQMDEQFVDPVKTYGTGFTPYFVPLSMWVGAMAIFVIFGSISTTEAREYKRFHLLLEMLRRYALYAVFGIVQAVVLGLVLINALGLQPNHTAQFYEFMIVLSFLFIALMMFLNYSFGHEAGTFIAVILLMLQLTSSGGTYPLETVPVFFQKIAPFLPMTYAVYALRDLISGSTARIDGVINLFLLAAVLLFAASVLVKTAIVRLSRPKDKSQPKPNPPVLRPNLTSVKGKIKLVGEALSRKIASIQEWQKQANLRFKFSKKK